MPINFHDEKNRGSYASRNADQVWKNAMRTRVDVKGLHVADVGCGGGIYARAWAELGAHMVTGVDSSPVMVDAAREQCAGMANVSFVVGDAAATGLNDASVDLVFERALIHHLPDLGPAMAEAVRLLKRSGRLIIQDRTPADVALPGSAEHIRGYFFERFPKLLAIEQGRRWPGEQVRAAMSAAGFANVSEQTLWETRRVYSDFSELAEDLRNRTGRSILHELTDDELEDLIDFVGKRLRHDQVIVEGDRWTIWMGQRD
ncbi:methyltransferase domain-containing protein [Alicyclobacillus cycloheptanicus]|uniref:Ubiquinone/menaquinone biosynthesis C-methylase UbiE n=1 Tax=Alicyclobacillus cycloheptanicus TaxID=1457 RepID=A0ABT9XF07_9BACL|nr:class I SAM-dependent methyltransferase [Alicyclobacillus cycloheptanicus]MDQ0188877.1 ubiquinone/menaquinone biosynthesis C-methylase UbiE [Alicyclobacillus cycloheptanicus]WDM00482.1 methyltransferase domain-containing protein [Alicyclobacillus cycloheptanicus]